MGVRSGGSHWEGRIGKERQQTQNKNTVYQVVSMCSMRKTKMGQGEQRVREVRGEVI